MIKERTKTGIMTMVMFLFSLSAVDAGEKFIVRPLIDISSMVETNFYKSDVEERTVTTLDVSPGMEFGYRTEKSRVAAKAALHVMTYDDLESVPLGMTDSDDNDYTGHNVSLSADTRLFSRITAGVDDTWINTRNPSERDAFDNFIDINEYTINRFKPWLKYKLTNRLAAEAAFNNTRIDYDESREEDSSLCVGRAGLSYEISRFTTIDLEYARSDMNYDMTSSDYTSEEYAVNFESKFKYFAFEGGIGLHDRDFDQSGMDSMDTVSWHFSVKGQNPPELGRDEKPRSYMKLEVARNFNTTGLANEYYTADRVTLVMGHLFMEKIDARIKARYQKSDYEQSIEDRDDDTWFFSARAACYVNERLTLTLTSGYEKRESSVAFDDYDNAFAAFQLTFNYDLGSR